MKDPFEAAYWNQLQVVLWAYWRSRGAVRRAADRHAPRDLAADDDDLPVPYTLDLIADVVMPGGRIGKRWRSRSRPAGSFEEKEREVIDALCRGDLQATGVEKGRGDRKSIPQNQWPDLQFYWAPVRYYDPISCAPRNYASPSVGLRELARPDAPHWTNVLFEREAVLALWPDRLPNYQSRDRTAAARKPVALAPEFLISNETPIPAGKQGRQGRKRKWDREAVEAEARRRLDAYPPEKPLELAPFARGIQDWFGKEHGGASPSDTWVEERVRPLVQDFRERRQKRK